MNTIKISVPTLRSTVTGQVIGPDDSGYDAARTVFAGGVDKKPAVIIRVSDTADVQNVVRIARESGLELAVRSGGHSGAGHSVSDGGIVLDLSRMKSIEIDTKSNTAWAQTGLTAAEYSKAAGAHQLATGFGDTGSVGIGGITTGGGIGYLVRKYGLTVDDVLGAEIVTADGSFHTVDATHESELFWAIRGGGGNFGVVTRFLYRLHKVPTVYGGMLILPATAETIPAFIREAETAPNELSTIANVMTAPPLPFLPKELQGSLIILAFLCYAGDAKSGETVVAKFRSVDTPIADFVKAMPYPDIYPPDQAGYHPIAASRTMFIDKVDEPVADTILTRLRASTGTMSACQLRVLGGAMADIPADATAFAHRTSEIMVNLAALYQDEKDKGLHETWVADFEKTLRQTDDGAYVNFLGNEGEARVRAAYPGKIWHRLQQSKKRYDPGNLFRLNQNIPPR